MLFISLDCFIVYKLLSFGDIGHLLSNIMGLNGALIVALTALNHDPVTQDNPHTLLWAVSYTVGTTFKLFLNLHETTLNNSVDYFE